MGGNRILTEMGTGGRHAPFPDIPRAAVDTHGRAKARPWRRIAVKKWTTGP
jgi:hypothetical protein